MVEISGEVVTNITAYHIPIANVMIIFHNEVKVCFSFLLPLLLLGR